MINQSDLRPGNIVEAPNDDHLMCETLTVYELNRNDARLCRSCGCCYETVEYEHISPVALNEDLLQKFGFKRHETGYYFKQVGNQLYLEYDPPFEAVRIVPETWNNVPIFPWNECNVAHQLQNLYFALTGEELQIK